MQELSDEVDFSGLILGFSSAALYYMGEQAVEGKSLGQKNLPLARQNINIIAMLREKTRGNLNPEEQRLLEQVVSDLQLRFLEVSKQD